MNRPISKSHEQIKTEAHHINAAKAMGGLSLAVLAFIGHNSLSSDEPSPEERRDTSPSVGYEAYKEAAVESAQNPLDRETETPVVDNIVVPSGMIPTEYIPNDPRYIEYLTKNPTEKTALVTSLNSQKTLDTDTYAIVERDIDGDGDTDAVVTQVIK